MLSTCLGRLTAGTCRTLPLAIRREKVTKHQETLMARGLPKRAPLPGVEHIVIVTSGKGGVGKSTVAVNLSVSLAKMGKRVGLLDADIFGPSVPLMMNIHEEPLVDDNNQMIPPINYGVKCLSMGLLAQQGAMIWRGPLVMSALQRLLKGALWGPLDILIVDTPPGTGDVHLSLAQNVPVSGVLLVSTPQTAALDVTERGAAMYRTLSVPLMGVVENMGHAICGNCQHHLKLFRRNEMHEFAKKMGVPLLASIPLDGNITEACDRGVPIVSSHSDSDYAKSFHQLAKSLAASLSRPAVESDEKVKAS